MAKVAAAALVLLGMISGALGQSAPNNPPMTYGYVPTVGVWNSWFQQKQDALGYQAANRGGDTFIGPLATAPSTTSFAGFTVSQGVAPTSPSNGNIWLTTSGLFVQVGGATVGPLVGPGGTGILPVPGGGTGVTSLTANGLVIGNGTSPVSVTAAPSAGQLIVGQSSAAPLPKTISGDCTVAASGAITCLSLNGNPLGISANNIVQLNGSAALPAVNGANLTGVVASGGLLNVQTFKVSGTYTRTSGATTGIVISIGGGGAGGGAPATAASTVSIGGGGGSGAQCILYNTALPSSATVTIGAGGTGVSGTTGGSGGTTSFNSTCTAAGGAGGSPSGPSNPTLVSGGGAGGAVGSTGTVDAPGSVGIFGVAGSTNICGGVGGATQFPGAGFGACGLVSSTGVNGSNAGGFGNGGGGAFVGNSGTAKTGGNGTGGIVIIYEYR